MSTVAKKVIMGSGAVAGAYEIEQSLILQATDIPILHRQAAATGNRRTFTFSCWYKSSGVEGVKKFISYGSGGDHDVYLSQYYQNLRVIFFDGSVNAQLFTTPFFRDYSAWYHLVLAVDTTQGTAANRIKLYVNGTQITDLSTATYPSQNFDTSFSLDDYYLNIAAYSGWHNNNNYNGGVDGNLAEVHVLDGVAKAPSDFGETNSDTGQWVPKKYEGGSYGTNGVYLKFASGAIGTDSSGEGNTMTVVNLANSDVVIDTPNNNFCTLNPLNIGSNATLSEGNLKFTNGEAAWNITKGTIAVESGKWYCETVVTQASQSNLGWGIVQSDHAVDTYIGNSSTEGKRGWCLYGSDGSSYTYYDGGNNNVAYTLADNDVLAMALDMDNGTIRWYKNGSLMAPSSGSNIDNVTGSVTFACTSTVSGNTSTFNFGQKDFTHTPPSGYVALSTANLPEPAIPLPSAQFNTLLYTGNAGTQSISGVGFQPDWVWAKNRSRAGGNGLFDAVRGAG